MKYIKWTLWMTLWASISIMLELLIEDVTGHRVGLLFITGFFFYRFQIGKSWALFAEDIKREK